MLFVEPRFFLFFAIVFLIYWAVPHNGARKWILLVASYVFYSAWDWRLTGLIALVTLFNWTLARAIARDRRPQPRRFYLLASVCLSLGILGFFKYFNFFIGSLASAAGMWGHRLAWNDINIILPVGISFYTFHTLGYVIDIYRRQVLPCRNLRDFALFVAFFPQLVAGPILRAENLLPQFRHRRVFTNVPVKACLTLFLVGFIKKTGVSDNLATFVDPVFANPLNYTSFSVVGAVAMYAVQIFCDFSGYSDMATAIAGLLGFRLWPNFAQPYLSTSLIEFWRRWHISLSTWLKDYLYVSIGGNRGGSLAKYRNLMITMILGGLWHGASWNFVIWGLLHGGGLCINHLYRFVRRGIGATFVSHRWFSKTEMFLGWVVTLWFVCLAWIFFRAVNPVQAVSIAKIYLGTSSPGHMTSAQSWPVVIALLMLLQLCCRLVRPEFAIQRMPAFACGAALGVMLAIALALLPHESRPFVYFQF